MLGNGVGLIDRSYRGELKAALVQYDGVSRWRSLLGQRVVQIVAPDAQPFDLIQVYTSDVEWQRFVSQFNIKDRGGGHGSTSQQEI